MLGPAPRLLPVLEGTRSASPEAVVQPAAGTWGAAHPPRQGRRVRTPGLLTPAAGQRLCRIRRHVPGGGRGPGLGRGQLGKVRVGGTVPVSPRPGPCGPGSGALPSGDALLRHPAGRGVTGAPGEGSPPSRRALPTLCHTSLGVRGLLRARWDGGGRPAVPGAVGVQALLVMTGESSGRAARAAPAAAICRGTPRLEGGGGSHPCRAGGRPRFGGHGGRGGGSAVHGSEQRQPRGTVQRGHKLC